MAMRLGNALYSYGLSRARIRAKNDDLTTASATNIIGGAGPFDFSSQTASIAAIPIFIKIGNAAVVSDTFDLTAAVDDSAVTADEIVTALTAAAIAGVTVSKQAVTNRIKFVFAASTAYVQVYGIGARLMMIGQGKGIKAIKCDTVQTMNSTPSMKEDTTLTITDANNKDTEVIISGYTKGWTGSIVDTAEDFELMELVESGELSLDGKTYTSPTSASKKVMFDIETYNPYYAAGTNTEDQIIAWEHKEFLAVKGSLGDNSKASGFGTRTYNLVGVNYKGAGSTETGAIVTTQIPLADWSPAIFDAI